MNRDKTYAYRDEYNKEHLIAIVGVPDWMATYVMAGLADAIKTETEFSRIGEAGFLAADLQELTKQLPIPSLSDVDLDEEEIKVNELKAIFDDVQKGES